jgi:hypothetical protein
MAAVREYVIGVVVMAMTLASAAPASAATDPHAPAKAAAPKPAAHAPAKPDAHAAPKPGAHAAPKPAEHAPPKPAEHAGAKTPPAAASHAAGHAKPSEVPAAPPVAPKPAPNSLLEVRDRIMTRAAEVAAGWKKAPAASPRAATASAPATTSAPAPARPRIQLIWRPAVSWPAELSGDATEAQAAAPDRVPVSWATPADDVVDSAD